MSDIPDPLRRAVAQLARFPGIGERTATRLSYWLLRQPPEVCREIAQESGLRVAAIHRVGALTIGDVALVAAVASPHRADAFAVCARLVDLVKERTPIWKRQHLAEGTTEWVGL